jgi:hypothetical protein
VTVTHQPPDVGALAGEGWVVDVTEAAPTPCSCGAGCETPDATCWGAVEVTDEQSDEDDTWWSHACSAHGGLS